MATSGADVVLEMPLAKFLPNPPRKPRYKSSTLETHLPLAEMPATQLYGGYAGLLVKTALLRADGWQDLARKAPILGSGDRVAKTLRHMAYQDQEHFVTLCLDGKSRLLAIHETSIGGYHGASVDPRMVAKIALLTSASAVITAHGHPSGDPTPSSVDRDLVKHLDETMKCVSVPMVDHIIIAREGYFSFFEHGLLSS